MEHLERIQFTTGIFIANPSNLQTALSTSQRIKTKNNTIAKSLIESNMTNQKRCCKIQRQKSSINETDFLDMTICKYYKDYDYTPGS